MGKKQSYWSLVNAYVGA